MMMLDFFKMAFTFAVAIAVGYFSLSGFEFYGTLYYGACGYFNGLFASG